MTQVIEPKEALAKIREAFNNKSLAAQNCKTQCKYIYDEEVAGGLDAPLDVLLKVQTKCAVGVILNDESLTTVINKGLNEDNSVNRLVYTGVIQFKSINDEMSFTALQNSHDKVCAALGIGLYKQAWDNLVEFEKTLTKLEGEYNG